MLPKRESALPSLRSAEFEWIQRLMLARYGIEVRAGKEEMVASRLAKVIRKKRLNSINDYCGYVRRDRTGRALLELVDALTTNHTSIFREPAHFTFLRTWLEKHAGSRSKVRIWSAGCATGEEPYSIACCAADTLGMEAAAGTIEVLGTDISTRALRTAGEAIYAASRFEEMPLSWRRRHLLQGCGLRNGYFQFKPHIRRMVRFSRLNLMEGQKPGLFSIIFCRNVLIYFTRENQQRVIRSLAACLENSGYLLVGHAEGFLGMDIPLAHIAPSIYQRHGEP